MQAIAKTDITPPVTTAELQEYLRLPEPDPTLAGVLLVASEAMVTHLRLDLGTREWIAYAPEPLRQPKQVEYRFKEYRARFELPYTALQSVDRVEVDGEETGDFTLDETRRPAVIAFDRIEPAEIRVEYTAGLDPVPDAIKEGIKALAAYLYEHRGQCSVTDALRQSGAAEMVKRWRVEAL